MLRAPDVLERVTAAAVGDDGAYLEATVKEILRRRPVLPIAGPRRIKQPIEIGGREYPAGPAFTACIYLVHHDERIYPEPYVFRPERFLDTSPATYSWIPFGGGVRRCLGAAFATLEMKVVIATILARTRLRAPRAQAAIGSRTRGRTEIGVPRRGLSVIERRPVPSRPGSAEVTSSADRIARSAIRISSCANEAPRQRRTPPPNGIQL